MSTNSSIFRRNLAGSPNNLCTRRGASLFDDEKQSKRTEHYCCHHGIVPLQLMKVSIPKVLKNLLLNQTEQAKEFRLNIRRYNNLFAFTSMKANLDHNLASLRKGLYTFRISGVLHHYMPVNIFPPTQSMKPKFAQIYFYDKDFQLKERSSSFKDLNKDTIEKLQTMIHKYNHLLKTFPGLSNFSKQNVDEITFQLREKKQRKYDLPEANEVGAIIPTHESTSKNRELTLAIRIKKDGTTIQKLQKISQFHAFYDALHYVLLYPSGESGWEIGLNTLRSTKGNHLTLLQYYRFKLFDRKGKYGMLLFSGRLYHQLIVDAWVKIEEQRLCWVRNNQKTIRAQMYAALDPKSEGKKIILPSTFSGSPRFFQKLFQNSLAIVRHFGKPTFFLTMTTNAEWPEIQNSLPPGVSANDRPDLVCRVFNLKAKRLIKYICSSNVLGKVLAYVYRVEFQKRGLPHLHCLIISERNTIRNAKDIDTYVSAEIPNQDDNPLLYETVTKKMMHGPCEKKPCFKEGKCTKNFPKGFAHETKMSFDGYAEYRRRNDGKFVYRSGKRLDNRFVVPFNPTLCLLFDAHINVEVCVTVRAVKYLYKYIYKNVDYLSVELRNPNDEILRFLDGRFITALEAAYHILGFLIHKESVVVMDLPVHLPGQQYVYYKLGQDMNKVRAAGKKTKLTAWFELNQRCETARSFLYYEIPEYFFWKSSSKSWIERKQRRTSIGRMVNVSPNAQELFYLRLLLTKVKGARSFQDLLTFNKEVQETFRDACIQRGLLEDDDFLAQTFKDICNFIPHPLKVFDMFVDYIIHTPVSAVNTFYKAVKETLLEQDKILNLHKKYPFNVHLFFIKKRLEEIYERKYVDFTLPEAPNDLQGFEQNVFSNPNLFGPENKPLNEEQKTFFDLVTKGNGQCFFLDGPGGCGKTYLLTAICSFFHRRNQKVWVCASSGIAATVIPTGKTAHSLLKIPVNCLENSMLNITKGTTLWNELKTVKLLVYDEISMASKNILDTIDRSLKDILDESKPFGGIKLIFCGDFRQLLPVKKFASPTQIVAECCKYSKVWEDVNIFRLTKNMRTTDLKWSKFILTVGNGEANDSEGNITLPEECTIVNSLQDLISQTFQRKFLMQEYSGSECILTTTNKLCDDVNDIIIDQLPDEETTYYSIDEMESDETIPVEFLHSLKIGGFPNHELRIKLGCIVMCLRNINEVLRNGTRLRVTRMEEKFIVGTVITEGPHYGKEEIIFMIKLISAPIDFPFQFSRRQLPIRHSYCLTIHKSQCQTFQRVGLYLPDDNQCFSHGQLYVALSRVAQGAKGLISTCKKLKNIVYPNALS